MPQDSSTYSLLAEALRERLAIVADRAWYSRNAAGHLAGLKTASDKITALQSQLPSPVDPQLAHYLQRCSYDKALAFLDAHNAANSPA